MLAPSSTAACRQRLVAAMDEVTRLLTASLVEIWRSTGHRRARRCLQRYFTELDDRFAAGFDPSGASPPASRNSGASAGTFLVAMLHGEPVGCGR